MRWVAYWGGGDLEGRVHKKAVKAPGGGPVGGSRPHAATAYRLACAMLRNRSAMGLIRKCPLTGAGSEES